MCAAIIPVAESREGRFCKLSGTKHLEFNCVFLYSVVAVFASDMQPKDAFCGLEGKCEMERIG